MVSKELTVLSGIRQLPSLPPITQHYYYHTAHPPSEF